LERQDIKAKYADLGGSTFSTSPIEFGKFLSEDIAKWAKLIKFAGLKPASSAPTFHNVRPAKPVASAATWHVAR
jgi:hypothetical protein